MFRDVKKCTTRDGNDCILVMKKLSPSEYIR